MPTEVLWTDVCNIVEQSDLNHLVGGTSLKAGDALALKNLFGVSEAQVVRFFTRVSQPSHRNIIVRRIANRAPDTLGQADLYRLQLARLLRPGYELVRPEALEFEGEDRNGRVQIARDLGDAIQKAQSILNGTAGLLFQRSVYGIWIADFGGHWELWAHYKFYSPGS